MTEPAEFITVYDAQGRPAKVNRTFWATDVLPATLAREWDNPERLSALITASLRDGFSSELRGAALRLQQIDPDPYKAVVLRAVIELRAHEPVEAERILREFLEEHPPSGLILTNLAKAQASQGRNEESEATLVQAIALDPNQENGLDWLMAIHRERGGEAAVDPVLEELSRRPGAWRPQLWLARGALGRGDISEALDLYRSALPSVRADGNGLMQISSDLGKAGRPADAVELVLPLYDPMQHGLPTGLNLINALMELDRLPEADAVAACMKALASPPNTSFFVELNRKLALAHAKETGRSRTLGWIRRKPRGHRS